MQQLTINALLSNAALLVFLSIIYELTYYLFLGTRIKQVINGILVALTCVAIMLVPFKFIPGVVFDTRSILISVAALIFGPVTTIIAIVPAIVFRLLYGGIGSLPGAAVILTSAIIGLIWRRWLYPKTMKLRWFNVYIMGLFVHITMMACMFLLPFPDSAIVVREIALPVMIIYPVATVLLYLLLTKQQVFWQMKEDLKQSEERFRLLFDKAPLAYQCLDIDGKFVDVNKQWLDTFGYSRDEVIGKFFCDYLNPVYKEEYLKSFHMFKELGHIHKELEIIHKSGRSIYVSFDGNIDCDYNGDFKQAYCILRDITAEKKAKHDYQLLFNSMVDGFALHEIICDQLGNPIDYRFLAVNPAFEQIVGKKASEVIGKTVLEVLPATESYWIETYGKVALTGESVKFENYTASTGKYFRVMAYQPAPMQFACTFSDDTLRIQAEEELFRTLARLRGLLDNSNSQIIVFDDKGNIVEISAAAERLIGLSRKEILGKDMEQLGLSDILKKAMHLSDNPTAAGQIIESIDVFEHGGEKKFYESRLFQIDTNNVNEKLFGYLGIDVTARIMAEQALKASEEKYSSYIENAPYAVFVVDENGNYLESNKAATAISGYSSEEILNMNIRDITAAESMNEAIYNFELLLKTGKMSTELKYYHKDGSTRWWTVDAVKISDKRFLGFSIDITDRKQAEANLINLSKHDYLTGVYNRRFFEAELKRMDNEKLLPLSVIVGDINGVKFINDAFGHSAGDKLITETAMILKNCCREGDVLARIGGDEFVIIMPNTDNSAASEVLRKIQAEITEFNTKNTSDIYQHSISLGCATKVSINEDIKEIIKIAEGYMYQHKLLEHNSIHSAIVSSIKATMFEKSHETEEHAQRLVSLSKAVGMALDLSQAELDKLVLLASLHDIGKVGIRDDILTKQGELDDMEWEEMKRHPEIGYRIAKTSPDLAPIAEGILCHHEWWDGSGYPQGIRGESIPLISRIVAVVDAYDAMTNDRPYRKALNHETAIKRIKQNAGTQFDPNIVKIFTEIVFDNTICMN